MAGDDRRRRADGSLPGSQFSRVDLLLRAPDGHGRPLVLMRRRSSSPHGAVWELPGASRRDHETPVATALGAAAEQAGVDPGRVRVRGAGIAHPGGSGTTIVADIPGPLPVHPAAHPAGPDAEVGQGAELGQVAELGQGAELAWIPEPEIGSLQLPPTLAASWPSLQAPDTVLLVDAANVVGSRPDGWWRDRAGAAERLLRAIAAAGPGVFALPSGGFRWVARLVVVLEGKAKQAPDIAGVEVVRAPGSGDDTIVKLAHDAGDHLVVTADRGLRARLPSSAWAVGPAMLRSWIAPGTAPARGAPRRPGGDRSEPG